MREGDESKLRNSRVRWLCWNAGSGGSAEAFKRVQCKQCMHIPESSAPLMVLAGAGVLEEPGCSVPWTSPEGFLAASSFPRVLGKGFGDSVSSGVVMWPV
jgi:hypothetical protein